MFAVAGNSDLRQHKRRVAAYVESTLPPLAVEAGTSVMVMQVDCRSPGCVPLETVVVIVFPRQIEHQQTRTNGTSAVGGVGRRRRRIAGPGRRKVGGANGVNKEKEKEIQQVIEKDKETQQEGVGKSNEDSSVPSKSFPLSTPLLSKPPNPEPIQDSTPLIPGIPESATGGTFKTRILLPLADVTLDDVLDALPPSFVGGRRTMGTIRLASRDALFSRLTQEFGGGGGENGESNSISDGDSGIDEDSGERVEESRKLRADVSNYLIECLNEYVSRGCISPPIGEPWPEKDDNGGGIDGLDVIGTTRVSPNVVEGRIEGTGNFVLRRKPDDVVEGNVIEDYKKEKKTEVISGTTRGRLEGFSDQHAPGIRSPGCPCCDPDNSAACDILLAKFL